MAMNVGSSGDEDEVVSAINTTPLVDVMLVLLIIFLITIPVVTHNVQLQLPKEFNIPTKTKPENINISVDKEGEIYWGMQLVPDNRTLISRLEQVSGKKPQPEVLIRGDQNSAYQSIGRVVFACQRAGIQKVGFITEPPAHGG